MARNPANDAFDDSPWDDDEDADQQALSALLGGDEDRSDRPAAPPSDAPTSSTMPIGGAPTVQPVTPGPAPSGGAQPSTFQGFTPRHAMEGFAFDREQNTGRSAKDAFAFLANQAPPPPINDKNALGAWFRQYIEPGMNELGHRVNSVNGDVFNFSNWQGTFDVDYGRGAGADGGALAWQVDPGSAQMGTGAYEPQQGGGGQAPQSMIAPPPPLTGSPQGGTDQTALEEILQEIEALMSGQGSPMDARALQGMLS